MFVSQVFSIKVQAADLLQVVDDLDTPISWVVYINNSEPLLTSALTFLQLKT